MKNMLLIVLITAILLPPNAFADKVIGITDGDTLTVLHDGQAVKIRVANIDAPEKTQIAGEKSKQALIKMCEGRDAAITPKGTDKYGRTIAVVRCNGIDVGREQVKNGLAWVYREYNNDSSLPPLEHAARNTKRGLWIAPSPIAPWDYRRNNASTPAGLATEDTTSAPAKKRKHKPCLVGSRGGRYHLSDSGTRVYGCKE